MSSTPNFEDFMDQLKNVMRGAASQPLQLNTDLDTLLDFAAYVPPAFKAGDVLHLREDAPYTFKHDVVFVRWLTPSDKAPIESAKLITNEDEDILVLVGITPTGFGVYAQVSSRFLTRSGT
jgi:hypothetical protein